MARPPARRTPSMASLLRQPSRGSLRDYASVLLSPRNSLHEPLEMEPLDPEETSESEEQAQGHAAASGPEEKDHLDDALSTIGFGAYQRRLLVLTGLGWAADNMWLQAIAAALPRIQDQFQISSVWSFCHDNLCGLARATLAKTKSSSETRALACCLLACSPSVSHTSRSRSQPMLI